MCSNGKYDFSRSNKLYKTYSKNWKTCKCLKFRFPVTGTIRAYYKMYTYRHIPYIVQRAQNCNLETRSRCSSLKYSCSARTGTRLLLSFKCFTFYLQPRQSRVNRMRTAVSQSVHNIIIHTWRLSRGDLSGRGKRSIIIVAVCSNKTHNIIIIIITVTVIIIIVTILAVYLHACKSYARSFSRVFLLHHVRGVYVYTGRFGSELRILLLLSPSIGRKRGGYSLLFAVWRNCIVLSILGWSWARAVPFVLEIMQ